MFTNEQREKIIDNLIAKESDSVDLDTLIQIFCDNYRDYLQDFSDEELKAEVDRLGYDLPKV